MHTCWVCTVCTCTLISSKLCSHNLHNNLHDQTFVTTVAESMRQYTKKKVEQAKVSHTRADGSSQVSLIAGNDWHAGRWHRELICHEARRSQCWFNIRINFLCIERQDNQTEISASISSDHASCNSSAVGTGRGSPLSQEDPILFWPPRANWNRYVHTNKVKNCHSYHCRYQIISEWLWLRPASHWWRKHPCSYVWGANNDMDDKITALALTTW
jgi:hypothetical protein